MVIKNHIQGSLLMKDRIMDVVENLCAQSGPLSLKHTTIAKELGIKPPSLYAHFPSMAAIFTATTKRALKEISITYNSIDGLYSPIEALNLIQSRQIDLLITRPGIARLVLFDLCQPGGMETIDWNTLEIVQITEKERTLFEKAISLKLISEQDFEFWFSTRIGALYIALSYEWLKTSKITPERVLALKKYLQITS